MTNEIDSLLAYLEKGYVLVPSHGRYGALADKVSKTYDTVKINVPVFRQSLKHEEHQPNVEHL